MTRRRKWLLALAISLALPFVAAVGFIAALEIAGAVGEFPAALLHARPVSLQLRDRHGTLLRDLPSAFGDRARRVRLADLPAHLRDAFLAAEDTRFYAHQGVDYLAIARAFWQTLTGKRSGGSTLTQQVVRLLSPRPRSWSAKWREAVLALRLERRWNKAQILEEYLNRVPLGPRTAGVDAASWGYFGKPAVHVSLAEAALLASLAKSPVQGDPRRDPGRAVARRDFVLGRMRQLGLIDGEAYRLALQTPLTLSRARWPFEAPHFTERLLRGAPGSGSVRTTLDARLQRRAEVLVRRTVGALRSRGGTQAAAVVLENRTGEILAYVGSANFWDPREGRNDAVQALRQPGSALKPFVYALAFEGDLTPASRLRDLPVRFTTAEGEYHPKNFNGRFHGPVLAREALANSYNIPAVRLARHVSLPVLLERMRAAGFASLRESPDHYGLGLVLGNGEVTLFELATAYLALARKGEWIEPSGVRGVSAPPPRRVFSQEAAYLVTDVLADPHARLAAFGEGSALEVPFPAAVKTGTSSDFRDNWTAGFSSEVTVAVWVGNFAGRPMRRISGVTGAAPLWNELIQAAMEGRTARDFERPPGLESALICPRSGRRVGPHCPGGRRERFRAGTVPEEPCDVHQAAEVDRRTGALAGAGCPAASRRRVLGERHPPRFGPWASAVGRPLLPERFSALCPETPSPPEIQIRSPADGEVFALTPDLPRSAQRLALEAVVTGAPEAVRWVVDGHLVSVTKFPFEGRWQLSPGEHEIVAEAEGVRSRGVRITVRE
jgi:penicillin-binding protein 1C